MKKLYIISKLKKRIHFLKNNNNLFLSMWKLNLGYGSCIGSFVLLLERRLKECLGMEGQE